MKELLAKEIEQINVVGAGLGIVMGGHTRQYCLGKAHLDYNLDTHAHSVFNLASIGKLFTTTLIFKYIEENKLALDTLVIDILTDLPVKWKDVTIQHLLTHSSGLPVYTTTLQYWKETRLDVSKQRILEYVKEMDLCFKPGSRWEYNNTGFYLLGLVIEALEQQPYFTAIQDRLLAPLGVYTIYPTNHYSVIPHRVNGYTKTLNGFIPAEYYSHAGTYAAGGFSADLPGFLAFEKALFEEKIINSLSLEQLLTPFPFSANDPIPGNSFQMGHGLFLFQHRGKKVYAHGGGIVGFSSAYIRVEDGFSAIIAVNTQDIDAGVLTHLLYKVYDKQEHDCSF